MQAKAVEVKSILANIERPHDAYSVQRSLLCSFHHDSNGFHQHRTHQVMADTDINLEISLEEYKEELTEVITQMMFVSGETAEASPETTTMIEEIVHTQVVEMVYPV